MKRHSKQRELIMKSLKKLDHPTAAEIHDDIKLEYPKISLGTVYRNLSELANSKIILRLPSSDGADRFDWNTDEHFHAHCTVCGKVFDLFGLLPREAVDSLDKAVEEHTGLSVSSREISFKGICKDCAKNKNFQ